MFIARSLVYYPGELKQNAEELSDEIIIPAYHLNNLMGDFEDGEALYLNMINIENNRKTLVAIGAPHSHDKNMIFAPQWILDLIASTGSSDPVIRLEKVSVEDMPVATKIVIKPLDPIAFELDILNCFETALMNLHSIQEGITIPITAAELGRDYVLYAHIEKVEPAPVSRIIECEVDVEFINEFESAQSMTATLPEPDIIPAPPPVTQTPVLSEEERRRQVRESWLKRFQNTSG
jgi:hypothetical protein